MTDMLMAASSQGALFSAFGAPNGSIEFKALAFSAHFQHSAIILYDRKV
jgi:hypothetical protein